MNPELAAANQLNGGVVNDQGDSNQVLEAVPVNVKPSYLFRQNINLKKQREVLQTEKTNDVNADKWKVCEMYDKEYFDFDAQGLEKPWNDNRGEKMDDYFNYGM